MITDRVSPYNPCLKKPKFLQARTRHKHDTNKIAIIGPSLTYLSVPPSERRGSSGPSGNTDNSPFDSHAKPFAPFGPCIVTSDEIKDPHNLVLWLTKNNEEKQRSNTKFLLFDIPSLISDISTGMTVEPGDIIATGTPSGVGAGRDPQEWMWPGDIIEACVEGIGTLRHPIINATPSGEV